MAWQVIVSAEDDDMRFALARERERVLARGDLPPIELDVLRGWRERREPSLRSSHVLPALARLVQVDAHGERVGPREWAIHGPETLIGRYHNAHGPVDVTLHGLLDHELYRVGSPHIRLKLHERGQWRVMALSPGAHTAVNGERLRKAHDEVEVAPGDVLTLGVVRLRLEVDEALDMSAWWRTLEDLLRTESNAALFLKRHGGVCGARHALRDDTSAVIGRSFPGAGALARPPHWGKHGELDWDLSGLFDHERRHVAFRHASLRPTSDRDWELCPLTRRHRVTVNRVEIFEPVTLRAGDEVGLGNMLFHFHHPRAGEPSQTPTIKLPNMIDWHAERVHSPPPIPPQWRGEGKSDE